MAGPQIAVEFVGDDKSAAAFLKQEARIQALESKLRDAGRAGQTAGNSISSGFDKGIGSAVKMAASFFSVQQGIQAAQASMAIFLQNMEQASTAGDKFAASVRGFAFEGGTRDQIQEILGQAAKHGIDKPDIAIDLADTLQDMLGGDRKAAMGEYKELLKLTGAGVKPEDLKDIGVAALSRGKSPGQFGREMVETAAQTGTEPAALTKFMRGIELFPDMGEGMATSVKLMQRLGERKTQSGLTSIVDAMGEGAPKDFQRFMKKAGKLGKGATFAEKMDALADAGVTTIEQLQKAGLSRAEAQPLSIALQNRGEIKRLAGGVPGAATPENLAARVAGAEAANPELLNQRVNASIRATQKMAEFMGPLAVEGQLVEQEGLRLGTGLRRGGVEQFGPMDMIDEQGRATTGAKVMNAAFGPPGDVVEKQLKAVDGLIEVTKNLYAVTANLRGGAALLPGNEDK